jgi:hypothetical protein
MTTESGDRTTANVPAAATPSDTPRTTGTILKAVGTRFRSDPVLIVPFAVAGFFVTLADWLRKQDPLPVATPHSFGQTLSVQYSLVPRGTARTVRHVGAFLDLRTPYFVGAVALELLALLAVGLAGWLTITRALGAEGQRSSLARYLGLLVAMVLHSRLLRPSTITIDSLLLGALAFLVAALVVVRLFLVPGLLVAGYRFPTALRDSVRASQGTRWALFWLIVIFGLASWGLAHVPIAGGFLSTAVVAPIHAVSLAVLIRRHDDESSTVSVSLSGD